MTKKLKRRGFLLSLLGLTSVGVVYSKKTNLLKLFVRDLEAKEFSLSDALPLDSQECILTPRQIEGPYYLKSPVRSASNIDIRSNRQGQHLRLKIQISNVTNCTPINNALVEIWHCDAYGEYSGFPNEFPHDLSKTIQLVTTKNIENGTTNDKMFLRGAQLTPMNGIVEFDTIIPGWYDPRAPHIHLRVQINEQEYITTQLYFNEQYTNNLYSKMAPYNLVNSIPYHHHNDMILKYQGAQGMLLNPTPIANQEGVEASVKISVAAPLS